jgi:hypothetical protein
MSAKRQNYNGKGFLNTFRPAKWITASNGLTCLTNNASNAACVRMGGVQASIRSQANHRRRKANIEGERERERSNHIT